VALELTENGRHGKRREGNAARRVEAINRLDQADRRDLLEIIAFCTDAVPAREMAREWKEPLHKRITIRAVASAVVTLKER
jgi:hypothetical protein